MEEKQIVDKLWDSYEPDPRHRPRSIGARSKTSPPETAGRQS